LNEATHNTKGVNAEEEEEITYKESCGDVLCKWFEKSDCSSVSVHFKELLRPGFSLQ
jgi:uncharacterized protein YodC (DUF2158 family)